jgi:hypothetical protein
MLFKFIKGLSELLFREKKIHSFFYLAGDCDFQEQPKSKFKSKLLEGQKKLEFFSLKNSSFDSLVNFNGTFNFGFLPLLRFCRAISFQNVYINQEVACLTIQTK